MFPVIASYTIPILDDGGIELLLAEAYQIPVNFTGSTEVGNILMRIPDDATNHGILFSNG